VQPAGAAVFCGFLPVPGRGLKAKFKELDYTNRKEGPFYRGALLLYFIE
jgi:hypothetical protein